MSLVERKRMWERERERVCVFLGLFMSEKAKAREIVKKERHSIKDKERRERRQRVKTTEGKIFGMI